MCADVGLAHVQLGLGRGKTATFNDDGKNPQQAQIHVRYVSDHGFSRQEEMNRTLSWCARLWALFNVRASSASMSAP
ncbi:hypothetical protein D3C80_1693310 [compost metagenome]